MYNGAILGVQGGTEKMLDYLAPARDHGVAVSAMWIQDWSGKIVTGFGTRVFWNWRWNETWYPDLDVVIQVSLYTSNKNYFHSPSSEELAAEDVKVTVYLTPHLNIDGDVFQSGAEEAGNWLTDINTNQTLLQDFGEFLVATADIIKPAPDCNCINVGR